MENTCPKCGSQDMKKGTMAATVGQVYMYPENNMNHKPSPITAHYCHNCGYIADFYVDQPGDLA